MRRGEQRRTALEAAAASPRSVPPPEALLERAEIVEQVARAVRTLEEPYRTAVLLRYFEDLSRDFPEIQVSSAPTRCLESTFGAAACSA